LARAVLPIAMAILPAASSSGVAAGAGRCGGAEASQAALLALAVTALALPSASGSLAILAAGGAASLFGLLARRQIGGYSGDVLGAMEQLAEIAALLAILAAQGGKA
jgi:adenosylcobinamide-GDP ribazoletransferase